MKLIGSLFLIFFISILNSSAQYPDWKTYTNGKQINCIAKEGNNIWVGTSGGLVMIDKNTSSRIIFTKENSGIPCIDVRCIKVDAAGNKWIGTWGGGLTKYDGSSWTYYNTTNSPITCNYITDLCFDRNQNLWIGQWEGLDRFSGTTWTRYTNLPVYTGAPGAVSKLAIDSSGILFVATMTGLFRYDGIQWTVFNKQNSGIQNTYIYDLTIDNNNVIWASSQVCAGVGGLIRLVDTTFTIFQAGINIEHIELDQNNNIWYSQSSSLIKFDGNNFTTFDSSNSQITDISQFSFLLEDSGTFWYATDPFNDLKRFDGHYNVSSYNTSAYNITFNSTGSICVNDYGNSLISIANTKCYGCQPAGSLDELAHNNFYNFNTICPLTTGWASTVAVDHQNNFWIGSYGNGVVKYDGSTSTFFDSLNSQLPTNNIWGNNSFAFDGLGNTFCAFKPVEDSIGYSHGGGLEKYDGVNWSPVSLPAPVIDDRITGIAIDHNNNLWVTRLDEIRKFDGTNWTLYTYSDLHSGNFTSIVVDLNNNVWVATDDTGLIKISNSVITFYNMTNSNLPSDNLGSLSVDIDNNLWIGLYNYYKSSGVSKFDGHTFTNYGIFNSGLSSFTIGQVVAKGNEIYITSDLGLTVFTDHTITGVDMINSFTEESLIKSIFPNPATDKITLKYDLKNEKAESLEIFNSANQSIYSVRDLESISKNSSVEIDTKQFTPAFYYCQLKSLKQISTKKFIVLRN